METRDWSLVVFTVLTQAAVGAFLTLQVLRYLAARRAASRIGRPTRNVPNTGRTGENARDDSPEASGAASVDGRSPAPLMIVLAVLSAGLFAALFHLSDPLQAARAVVNFSSSWLSREIVFGNLFAALLGALVWHEWRETDSGPANAARGQSAPGSGPANRAPARAAFTMWLPGLTSVAGLAFLTCQIAIYLLPAQPAWNSFATPAGFGGTALRLGVLGVAAGLVVRDLPAGVHDPARAHPIGNGGSLSATLCGLTLAGIAALALEFVVVPLQLVSLGANPLPAAAASVQRLTGDYGAILLLRLGLLGAAAAALGGALAISRWPFIPAGLAGPASQRLASALTCGAFVLTVASEVCGRFLFYAMQVRVGI